MIVSPLTGSANVTLIRRMQATEIVDIWRRSAGLDVTAELKGHLQIELYLCNATGVKFFSPGDIFGSDKLYEQLSAGSYYQQSSWEHAVAAQDIASCKDILEIGCGFGSFLRALERDHGIHAQGIEINELAVLTATSAGLRVECAELCEYAPNHRGQFDAVVAFQVLEHVPNPNEFLLACVDLLKPGGKLILAVPNDDSYMGISEDNPRNLPPHHMTRWGKRSMRSIAKWYHLKLLHLRSESLSRDYIEYYARAKIATGPSSRLGRAIWLRIVRRVIVPTLTTFRLARNCIAGHTLYTCFEKE